MAITGQELIQVGIENQATGADSIFAAFNKTQNNFTQLFDSASPYVNFVAGNGIQTAQSGNTVTINNTGILNIVPGTGVTVLQTGSNVTISASGNGLAGVTNVGITSTTLSVFNSPVISSGVITINLPVLPVSSKFIPGTYQAPILDVDAYGRITSIANLTTFGTVTNIAVQAHGPGIAVSGSPIVDSGVVTIKNTGVTKINAGKGIALSGHIGEITISTTQLNTGTVTRVDIQSSTLTVVNSPITTDGTIIVEIPNNVNLSGNLVARQITGQTTIIATGNITGGNVITAGLVSATGNVAGGNITTAGVVSATGNIIGSNIVGNTSVQGSTIKVTGSRSIGSWGVTGAGFVISSATYTDTSVAASGSLANAHIHVVSIPTINTTNASTTITKAATWFIEGAPSNGANVIINNPYALQVANGVVQIDSTAVSTSATTGALRVAGGAGISGNLNVGTDLNVSGNIAITGNVVAANVIATVNLGLVANGTNQATALRLSRQVNVITTSGTGANGVVLPSGITGTTVKVVNDTASTLNVYPAVGCQINRLGSNMPFVLSANTRTSLTAVDPNQWFSF